MDYQLTIPANMRRAAPMYANVAVASCAADGTIHRYRYGDMLRRARQLAVALQGLGIRAGDRVGTLAWNHHQHLEAYFAVPAIGAVQKWWLPDSMEFIDEIPRTSTGKFLKSALRERFRQRYAQTLER